MTTSPPTVVLVDDHPELIEVVCAALRGGYEIVATAGDGESFLEEVRRHGPEVVVVDITLPGMSGLEAVQQLVREGFAGAVVMLTLHHDRDLVEAARDVGALGYVVKDRLATDLCRAIEDARAGRSFVSPMS